MKGRVMTERVWFTPIGHAQYLHTFDERQAAFWRDRGSMVDEYVKVEPAAAGDDGGSSPAQQPSPAALAEDVERVGLAIAREIGCGFTVKGKFVLCDHPDVLDPQTDCSCRRAASAALAAIPDRRREGMLEAASMAEEETKRMQKAAMALDPSNTFSRMDYNGGIGALSALARAIRAAADAAPGDTGEKQEGMPGLGWTLSAESQAALDAIDANMREAAIRFGRTLIGSCP